MKMCKFDRLISQLLMEDHIDRKNRSWKLLTEDEMEKMYLFTFSIETDAVSSEFLIIDAKSTVTHSNCWKSEQHIMIKNINERYPYIDELLVNMQGKLFVAGGAVVRSLYQNYRHYATDIDIFFVDCNEKQREEILVKSITFLSHKFLTERFLPDNYNNNNRYEPLTEDQIKNRKIYITRNEFVVTLYCCINNQYDLTFKYQFILRVYPNTVSVLGGFDLSISMCGYDGYNIVATKLGAFSLLSSYSIVDISRRSTTFEQRIRKYNNLCNFVYPGLAKEDLQVSIILEEQKTYRDVMNEAYQLMADHNYEWNGKYISSNPTIIEEKRRIIEKIRQTAWDAGYILNNFLDINLDKISRSYAKGEISAIEMEKIVDDFLNKNGYYHEKYNYNSDGITPKYGFSIENYYKTSYTKLQLPYLTLYLRAFNGKNKRSPLSRARVKRENKIEKSDYGDQTYCFLEYLAAMNTSMLANNKLAAVVSILILTTKNTKIGSFRELSNCVVNLNDNDLNIKTIENVIATSFKRVQLGDILTTYDRQLTGGKRHITGINIQTLRARFAEYGDEMVNKIPERVGNFNQIEHYIFDTEYGQRYIEISEIIRKRIIDNMEKVVANLSIIKWITENPGRQWTSSINPIVKDARDWYGEYYTGFRIGEIKIEIVLRLMRKRKNNLISSLNRDLFNLILQRYFYMYN